MNHCCLFCNWSVIQLNLLPANPSNFLLYTFNSFLLLTCQLQPSNSLTFIYQAQLVFICVVNSFRSVCLARMEWNEIDQWMKWTINKIVDYHFFRFALLLYWKWSMDSCCFGGKKRHINKIKLICYENRCIRKWDLPSGHPLLNLRIYTIKMYC